jgi:hypothetical protein
MHVPPFGQTTQEPVPSEATTHDSHFVASHGFARQVDPHWFAAGQQLVWQVPGVGGFVVLSSPQQSPVQHWLALKHAPFVSTQQEAPR